MNLFKDNNQLLKKSCEKRDIYPSNHCGYILQSQF